MIYPLLYALSRVLPGSPKATTPRPRAPRTGGYTATRPADEAGPPPAGPAPGGPTHRRPCCCRS